VRCSDAYDNAQGPPRSRRVSALRLVKRSSPFFAHSRVAAITRSSNLAFLAFRSLPQPRRQRRVRNCVLRQPSKGLGSRRDSTSSKPSLAAWPFRSALPPQGGSRRPARQPVIAEMRYSFRPNGRRTDGSCQSITNSSVIEKPRRPTFITLIVSRFKVLANLRGRCCDEPMWDPLPCSNSLLLRAWMKGGRASLYRSKLPAHRFAVACHYERPLPAFHCVPSPSHSRLRRSRLRDASLLCSRL